MPHGFKLLYLSLFYTFLFYQIVSMLQLEQIQCFPKQKKVSFDSSRSQRSRISRRNKTVFLTSRRINHTALPRALPFAIPSPPHYLAALLHLPPPLSVLKTFETHMWADGLISHHAGAVSACHKCSVDID